MCIPSITGTSWMFEWLSTNNLHKLQNASASTREIRGHKTYVYHYSPILRHPSLAYLCIYYIYTHTYIWYMYIYIYIYYIYNYIYIYTHICMYMNIYIYIYVCSTISMQQNKMQPNVGIYYHVMHSYIVNPPQIHHDYWCDFNHQFIWMVYPLVI